MRSPDRLESALEAHRAAVGAFAARVERSDPQRWTRRLASDAWSPAEITEHLVLVFDAVGREIEGGEGIRLRLGPLWRFFFRWTVLPRILAGRSFPAGAKAVREARPSEVEHSREVSLRRLESAAARLEAAARSAPSGMRISHPYFGRLSLRRAVLFSAAHVRHHAAQIPLDPSSG